MTQKALFSFKKISRPALFAFVLILHAAILICVKVSVKAAEEEQFVDAELFKLVDVEEYVPPPPPVGAYNSPPTPSISKSAIFEGFINIRPSDPIPKCRLLSCFAASQ